MIDTKIKISYMEGRPKLTKSQGGSQFTLFLESKIKKNVHRASAKQARENSSSIRNAGSRLRWIEGSADKTHHVISDIRVNDRWSDEICHDKALPHVIPAAFIVEVGKPLSSTGRLGKKYDCRRIPGRHDEERWFGAKGWILRLPPLVHIDSAFRVVALRTNKITGMWGTGKIVDKGPERSCYRKVSIPLSDN
ncbi:hypothetical protein ARMSODRAFT_981685 [Armillaria solidipes]|uniref:Uncharacterized protein n=1 Tax=Armillaria solidipes TaxID=1076256 RepID=A0A2H3ARC9_9AGAR|nr:hypothetical protein ARMSODRAFT_981685 [Armillaria solidipes]